MSRFDTMFQSMRTDNFHEKKQFLQFFSQICEREIFRLTETDRDALLVYAYEEVENILLAIPKAADYKQKNIIFECHSLLMHIVMCIAGSADNLPEDKLTRMQLLAELVENDRRIETTLDDIFNQDAITKEDVNRLLYWVRMSTDEYQKGMLLQGLSHYQHDLDKFDEGAKQILTDYFSEELRRLPQAGTEDAWNSLELLADICRFFPDKRIMDALAALFPLGRNHVNYFAMDTLYLLGIDVPQYVINALAADLEYANMTYHTLKSSGKVALFPQEYASEEYLAKSDLVRWLTYPTELGKVPDEIEYIGRVKKLFRKEVFHVFRFRSDSNTLDDARKNKWLIGWSSNEGGTFSNFDEYVLFEGSTPQATLRNIRKKLL